MESKPGYVPPALRHKTTYKPRNLAYKPKVLWTPETKSTQQLLEEYRKQNEGKADDAWD